MRIPDFVFLCVGVWVVAAISLCVILCCVRSMHSVWQSRNENRYEQWAKVVCASIDRWCDYEFPQVGFTAREISKSISSGWSFDNCAFRDKLREKFVEVRARNDDGQKQYDKIENENIALEARLAEAVRVLEEISADKRVACVVDNTNCESQQIAQRFFLQSPIPSKILERQRLEQEIISYSATVRNDLLIEDDGVMMSMQCKEWVDGLIEKLQAYDALGEEEGK